MNANSLHNQHSSLRALRGQLKVNFWTKKHESCPRNKLIASVLYACHMIERWGRGTQEMVELCQKSGNPTPYFEEMTGSLWVTLPLREPIPRVTLSPTPSVRLTDRQQEIMNLLRQGPLGRKQIINSIKNPPSDRTIQAELLTLNKLGLIVPEGKARAIIWV